MTDNQDTGVAPFPIVGIGASAGGLEAFEAFFRACPADSGMGFVLVPHLDPGHDSLLTEILQRSTAMPVSMGQAWKKASKASRPPAEAPMPMMGKATGDAAAEPSSTTVGRLSRVLMGERPRPTSAAKGTAEFRSGHAHLLGFYRPMRDVRSSLDVVS